MTPRSDPKVRPEHPSDGPAPKREPVVDAPDEEVEPRDSSGGPTTLDWWLDDGPASPIAADIKEPEKHL